MPTHLEDSPGAIWTWPYTWLFEPCLVLLRHPLLVLAMALLGAVLLAGAGRSFGVPLLFWHERRDTQRIAGVATTLLAAHVVFVVALSESKDQPQALALVAVSILLWGTVVGTSVWRRAAAWRRAETPPAGSANEERASRHAPRAARLRTLMPPIRSVQDKRLGDSVALEVPPWGFLQGALLGACCLAALFCIDRAAGEWIDETIGRRLATLLPHMIVNPRLHLLALGVTAIQVFFFLVLPRFATPAVGICMLVSLVAAADGAATFWLQSSGLAFLLLAAALVWAGRELYAIRIPELEPLYPHPAAYPGHPWAAPAGATPHVVDALADAMRDVPDWPDDGLPRQRPLILVCASGGGIRAAAWTSRVLERLQALRPYPDRPHQPFPNLTVMITGASGGMVGAAAWVAALFHADQRPAQEPRSQSLVSTAVSANALTALARALVFRDVPLALANRPNLADRGRALQGAWHEALSQTLGVDFNVPLAALDPGERRGKWPSLVFSPTVVEDGTRLLISNLDLKTLTYSEAPWLAKSSGGPAGRSIASTSAHHAKQLFGQSADRITLATAARLSASFPYMSPAAVLPTRPRRRVVDAGYYDNYGVDVATNWLREALEHHHGWLARHVSKILVIQIRDSHMYVGDPADPEPRTTDDEGWGSRLARGLEGLTSPLECFAHSRESIMRFRNDAQLDAVSQMVARAFGDPNFLLTTIFELKSHVSLSWYLSEMERREIDNQAQSEHISEKLQDVAKWMRG
ncbi:MAG TPA: hypothetical protein VGY54_15505 [Polyangiaceae bacterium]|nr:hypothetical protein [Polyangiaceae bacterium]